MDLYEALEYWDTNTPPVRLLDAWRLDIFASTVPANDSKDGGERTLAI